MKCYECIKAGTTQDAVAVCAVCGKGLCLDHALERELSLTPRVSGWANSMATHIICQACATALPVTA
jgi:hypothetical protein